MHGPGGGRGKWAEAGIPKKGWRCINVEDLGEPSMQCEMCEQMEIRYVHYMQNDRYPNVLACGEICAGHMENDLVAAERRDKSMRSSAGKRKRFPQLTGWYLSSKGNPTLKRGQFTVTVFQRGVNWKAVVNVKGSNDPLYTRDIFPTKEEAQRAAYDTLTFAEERAAQQRRSVIPWENDLL